MCTHNAATRVDTGTKTVFGDRSSEHGLVEHAVAIEVRRLLFETKAASRIGRFVVLEHLADGGMGSVYVAHDEQLERTVAVKVLRSDALPSEDDHRRFRREARALALVSHPNVVTTYDVGDVKGEPYLVMEFIRGQSVDAWLATEPGWRDVLEVFIAAGRGLAAVHRAGLVHRDFKPHNIMRSDDGEVRLIDFGVARVAAERYGWLAECADDSWDEASREELGGSLTRPGAIVGTPAYMSPEQLQGKTCDAPSDQYSFCLSLFEALYGERPRVGCSRRELSRMMRRLRGRSSSVVPGWLGRVLLRGLAIEPDARWPSMEALTEALQRSRGGRHRGLVRLVRASALALGALGMQAWSLVGPQ